MKTNSDTFFKGALLLILVLACIPAFLSKVARVNEKPLQGAVTLAPNIDFSWENWFEGDYSENKEKYLNDHIGFHNFLIRLRNQISYSLFNEAFARGVVGGKEGMLYEQYYIEARAGLDFIGDLTIKENIRKLKVIQDSLQRKNKLLIFLLAPGKATVYPDYINSYFPPTKNSNYLRYKYFAEKENINVLDFNAYLYQLRSTSPYPLFPKTGTHWSNYAMYLAFDTLTCFIETKSHKKLRHCDFSKVELKKDTLRFSDADIEEGMNLFFPLSHFEMAYPIPKWQDTAGAFAPKVLTMGDSFWHCLYDAQIPQQSFKDHQFWSYNKAVFAPWYHGEQGNTADLDLKETLEKQDIIILLSTEGTLKQFSWGFIEEVYDMYTKGPDAYTELQNSRKEKQTLIATMNNIRNAPDWYGKVKRQAKELGISNDSAVYLNAVHLMNIEREKRKKRE
jgi:hypothetical protein